MNKSSGYAGRLPYLLLYTRILGGSPFRRGSRECHWYRRNPCSCALAWVGAYPPRAVPNIASGTAHPVRARVAPAAAAAVVNLVAADSCTPLGHEKSPVRCPHYRIGLSICQGHWSNICIFLRRSLIRTCALNARPLCLKWSLAASTRGLEENDYLLQV